VAFSPQGNYTNTLTAATAKSVATSAVRGCCVVRATGPYGLQSRFSRPKPLLLLSSSSSIMLLRKSGSAGNLTRDLWICSQELWPLNNSSGHRHWFGADSSRLLLNPAMVSLLLLTLQRTVREWPV
jgi:hypothetical protein